VWSAAPRQRPEHAQEPLVELVERARFEGVSGEHADHVLAREQRTAKTCMYVARRVRIRE
jgi:hypothetical protein